MKALTISAKAYILFICALGLSLSSCGTLNGLSKSSKAQQVGQMEFEFTPAFPEISQDDIAALSNKDIFKSGDTAEVTIYNVESLSGEYTVDRSGNIPFPLIGSIRVSGLTTEDLQETLIQRYGATHLQNPNVSVKLEARELGRVVVDGAVEKPGVFEISEIISVSEAIALAQGLTLEANAQELYLVRTISGVRKVQLVNLQDIRLAGAADPKVIPGDVLFVQDSQSRILFREFLKTIPLLNAFTIYSTR